MTLCQQLDLCNESHLFLRAFTRQFSQAYIISYASISVSLIDLAFGINIALG